MLTSDRYKAMQNPPTPTINHEYEYLQAKSTGYGNGSLFSNIGVSHHQNSGLTGVGKPGVGRRKNGSLFGTVFIFGTALLVFQYLYRQPSDLTVSSISAVVAMWVAAQVYAVPTIRKLVDSAGRIATLLGLIYFFSQAS